MDFISYFENSKRDLRIYFRFRHFIRVFMHFMTWFGYNQGVKYEFHNLSGSIVFNKFYSLDIKGQKFAHGHFWDYENLSRTAE